MIVEQIKQTLGARKKAALADYYKAIRDGDDPELVLSTAEAAGVSVDQIQKDSELLDRGRELSAAASQLPQLETELAATQAAAQAADRELQAAVSRLQPVAAFAAIRVQQIGDTLRTAKRAAADLIGMTREHPQLLTGR